MVGEIEEVVKTGLWVGDCFIYTNSVNRLNYYVGGEIVTIAHLDRLAFKGLKLNSTYRVINQLDYIPKMCLGVEYDQFVILYHTSVIKGLKYCVSDCGYIPKKQCMYLRNKELNVIIIF